MGRRVLNAIEIIRQVYAHDGKLLLEDDRIKVEAPVPLPDNLRQVIRMHKPSIMVALGSPLDIAVASVLEELRPNLPQALRKLSDDKLLALVNWSIITAWGRMIRKDSN